MSDLFRYGQQNGSGEDVLVPSTETYRIVGDSNGGPCVECSANQPVELILQILVGWRGDVAFLFVLLLSRKGRHQEGRYQSPYVSVEEATLFLTTFKEFLERDGRQELWVHLPPDNQIVNDRHGSTWLYGDLGVFSDRLRLLGLKEGPVPYVPIPHTHHYHWQFDDDEDRVMEYWEWTRHPLKDSDGD